MHWRVDMMGRVGPASVPKRSSVRTKAASFNQHASRNSLLKLFWHPCIVAILPDFLYFILSQICGIIAFPLKVFTKSADAEREGSFLFITILRQSNDCWLKDDYCDLQLCCSVAALVSAPLFSSLSSERSLTRFKSPSSTSLVPVFCCSMQQNKIKVTCIYICRWSLY